MPAYISQQKVANKKASLRIWKAGDDAYWFGTDNPNRPIQTIRPGGSCASS